MFSSKDRNGTQDTVHGFLSFRKIAFTFIIAALAIACVALIADSDTSDADYPSGTCGANVSWELNTDDGILTIAGTGEMNGYQPYSLPGWGSYRDQITSVVVSDGVTTLGSNSFIGCTHLVSVSLPDSLVTIGFGAFSGCTRLTSVTVPNSVTAIFSEAFRGCYNLNTITIGSSVESFGTSSINNSFQYCYNLVEVFNLSSLPIEKGSDEYGAVAKYAEILSSTVLPSAVTSQGGFRHITLGEDTVLLGYVGYDTDLILPDKMAGNDYVIHAHAFNSNSDLTSVTFGSGVKSIGEKAFASCSKLAALNNLGAVESIGVSAFASCSKLTSLTIGEGTQSIGEQAFYSCYGITSVSLPASVTSIGDNAFYSCSGLTSITVDPSNANYCSDSGVLFDKGKTVLIKYPTARNATTYAIPSTVETIADNAFMANTHLTSVSVPNGVVSIGKQAFYGCSNVTTVTIGTGLASLGVNVFAMANSLESFTVDPANASYCSEGGVLYDIGKTVLIQYPAKKTAESYTAPGTVATVSEYAFFRNTFIVSVTLTSAVTSIGRDAFYGCTSLTQVSGGSRVASIGTAAFQNCSNLVSIDLQSVTTVDPYAFQNCTHLGSVNLSSVVSIGNSGFYGCSTIMSLSLPDSLTFMDSHAFNGCTSLETVVLGNGLTVINQSIFSGCTSLRSIVIPDSVESIEYAAFQQCSSMTDVHIGDGVKKIGGNVFWNNNSIAKIYIGVSLESIDTSGTGSFRTTTFYDSDGTTVLDKTPEKLRNSLFQMDGTKLVKVAVDIVTVGSTSTMASDTDSAVVSQNDITFLKNKAITNTDTTLQINLKDGKAASLDAKAISTLGDAPTELKVESVDKSTLSEEDKKIVGDNPVYEITFGANTNFGDGKATFTVPYTLPEGKSADKLKVFCIKDGAVAETIDCTYADGKATFGTSHLSMYYLGFEDSSDDGGSGGGDFPIWIAAVIAVVVIAAAGGAFFLVKKKKA